VTSARRAMLAVLLGCAAAPASSQQAPTFSARIDAVRVDVLVTDHGRPVVGLKASDFEVIDNGVRQQVDLAAFDAIPLNVVLALDVSASMAGEPLAQLKAAGRAVADGLAPDDRAGLITFSQVVRLRLPLTADRAAVRAALDASWAGGDTALVDAAEAAVILGASDVGRALVILFSDGVDTSSWLAPPVVLQSARRADAVVYAVSSQRTGTLPKFLDDLCDATGGRLLKVDSPDALTPTLLQVIREFRQRYVVSYTPHGVAPDGWHALQVRVRDRSVTVKARPGYLAAQR
jgi:Ca-activated chloride channel homolog